MLAFNCIRTSCNMHIAPGSGSGVDSSRTRQSPTGYHGDEVCTPTGMSEWSAGFWRKISSTLATIVGDYSRQSRQCDYSRQHGRGFRV